MAVGACNQLMMKIRIYASDLHFKVGNAFHKKPRRKKGKKGEILCGKVASLFIGH